MYVLDVRIELKKKQTNRRVSQGVDKYLHVARLCSSRFLSDITRGTLKAWSTHALRKETTATQAELHISCLHFDWLRCLENQQKRIDANAKKVFRTFNININFV